VARLRILHCSDLHLSDRPYRYGLPDVLDNWVQHGLPPLAAISRVSSQDPDIVRALAEFAVTNSSGYDVLLVSGDIATTGSDADLQRAASLFEAPAITAGFLTGQDAPTIQPLQNKLALIPGNHDRFGPATAGALGYSPGSKNFERFFSPFWNAAHGARELRAIGKNGTTLVLIGADFTLQSADLGHGMFGHLGQGRAYPNCLNALRQLTADARTRYPKAIVVWVIHFDPLRIDGSCALLDAGDFVDAVEREGIPAVLCGHTHHKGTRHLALASVHVCGTSTQLYAPDGHYVSLLEVDAADPAQPSVRVAQFRFSDDHQTFILDP
jgi:hypothetical protein